MAFCNGEEWFQILGCMFLSSLGISVLYCFAWRQSLGNNVFIMETGVVLNMDQNL